MTIDNLYGMCKQRKFLIMPAKEGRDSPKNFDNMQLSGENAVG
jgi:hypothetical protein